MRTPTYLTFRAESGAYYFRWVVPTFLRGLLGGRREIRRTLGTSDKRVALKLATQLAVALEQGAIEVSKQGENTNQKGMMYMFLRYVEQMADGRTKTLSAHLDPNRLEAEKALLAEAVKTLGLRGEPTAASESPSSGMTLVDAVKAYSDEMERGNRWTKKTTHELASAYAVLCEVAGPTKSIAQLSREDMTRFKNVLTKLPKNRRTSPRYKGLGALELASMAIPDNDLLDTRTVNKIIARVSSLLGWAVNNGHMSVNLAKGLPIPMKVRKADERPPFTDAEVLRLITAVVAGEHGAGQRPWRKWSVLMGAYTGARLNEIASLHLADFKVVEGIPCISINTDAPMKRVKTRNAERLIPLHPELVKHGLLDHVEALRSKGVERLFPELSAGRDGYGQQASLWFSSYRKRFGIDKPYHSLRHSFTDKLRGAGVTEDLAADILGHERSNRETYGTYATDAMVAVKYDAICKVSYTSNVVALRPAAAA